MKGKYSLLYSDSNKVPEGSCARKTAGLQLTFMSIRSKVISQLAICNGRYFPLLNLKLLNLMTFLEIISQSFVSSIYNHSIHK